MEWIQSTLSKDFYPSSRTSPHKTSDNDRRKSATPDIAYLHLKQSYNDRIQSLENQVKQIYKEIQCDALLETMGHNQASSIFRNQRIQEIVEDSLLTEKEAQIELLIQENSYLKSELISLKEDSQNLAQASLDEITGLQAVANELNQKLQEQVRITQLLEQDNEALKESVVKLQNDYELVLTQTEGETGDMKRTYLDSLASLEYEFEDVKRRKETLEMESKEKDLMLSELKLTKESLRKELALKEESFSVMKLENYKLETALRELHHTRDKNQAYEEEIRSLKSELKSTQNSLRDNRESMKTPTKNYDAATTSRLLVLETQQKAHNDKVEEVKKKYKQKCEKYKEKSKELASLTESLNSQVSTLKQSLEFEREQVSKLKSQKEEDMRVLKSKLEEKITKQELEHQKSLAEFRVQSQLTVSQLESEKSKLESKAAEALNYSSNYSSKARSYEMESKAKMETSMIQIENNYILKSKHENILTVETMELQAKHAKEVQRLTEEFEREIKRKSRDIQENYEIEHTGTIKNIRESKMRVEEELDQKKKEVLKLTDKQDDQRKVIKNLREELDDSKKKTNELHTNLVEANHKLTDLKSLHETETKKTLKLEGENKEILREKTEILKKKAEVDTANTQLKEQMKRLEEIKRSIEESVKKLDTKNGNLNAENRDLIRKLEEVTHEKHSLRREFDETVNSLGRDIQKLNQMIVDEKREGENKDLIIQNERYNKEQLEIAVQDLQQVEQKLTNDLTSTQEVCIQLHNRLTDQKSEFKMNISKIWKLVSAQIEGLKRQLETLKSNVRLQAEKNQNAAKLEIQSLVHYFTNSMNMLKSQKAEEERAMLEQHESDVGRYERALRKYEDENAELNLEVEKLNKHVTTTLDTLEQAKTLISDYSLQIENLKVKNYDLSQKVSETNKVNAGQKKDLKETQDLVDSEIKKMNDDLQVSVPSIVNKLKAEHRAEIVKMMDELDEVKRRETKKLKSFEDSILDLQRDFENQLGEVKKASKNKSGKYEEKLEELRIKCEEQVKENLRLNEELKKNKEVCYELDRENKRTIGKYEGKIQDITGLIRKETMYSELEKERTFQENGKLRQSLNDLKQKLEICDLEISALNQVKNDQQECIFKYQNILDKKKRPNDEPKVSFKGY